MNNYERPKGSDHYTPPPELASKDAHIKALQHDLQESDAENRQLRDRLDVMRETINRLTMERHDGTLSECDIDVLEDTLGIDDGIICRRLKLNPELFAEMRAGRRIFPAWLAVKIARQFHFDATKINWPKCRFEHRIEL